MPRLTEGQVIVGIARMAAMLHDDETQVILPAGASFPFRLIWAGGKLYLVSLTPAERDLLGAQILAVGGQPIAQVLSRIVSVIDYQDPGLLEDDEAGYLRSFPPLLYWLGVTRAPGWGCVYGLCCQRRSQRGAAVRGDGRPGRCPGQHPAAAVLA